MVTLGLVVSRFNASVTEVMAEEAREAAEEHGAEIAETLSVPGAYDTPLAADRLARRDDIDAVAVIGAIVTGETDHDQVIARTAADGLTKVSLDRDTPVTLGITGPGMNPDQARARIGNAGTAVESAIDLAERHQ
ncbi:6,7-dimethyl-8-ribityllumazine synthase [Natronorarus salvus]|uniref:6,7-dimethyl-8-ribityllumazine synthase n=1 Tax=Natronorarus salvus TaxID=3117733 RepID=UPI002F26A91E